MRKVMFLIVIALLTLTGCAKAQPTPTPLVQPKAGYDFSAQLHTEGQSYNLITYCDCELRVWTGNLSLFDAEQEIVSSNDGTVIASGRHEFSWSVDEYSTWGVQFDAEGEGNMTLVISGSWQGGDKIRIRDEANFRQELDGFTIERKNEQTLIYGNFAD